MNPIIIALDLNPQKASALVEKLDPQLCRLKIGKELFTRGGPALVEKWVQLNFDIFLDLKFHDIPNTVAAACDAAADLGIWMINIHALGGLKMMAAARERLDRHRQPPQLIAVTLLTSLDQNELAQLGCTEPVEQMVSRLAALADQAGLDGVVCSPLEVARLRSERGPDFKLITPGIRPVDAAIHDQKRIMTPAEAMQSGSDYLVIGRPITQAEDPLKALQNIRRSMGLSV